jgi:hypothetical protein
MSSKATSALMEAHVEQDGIKRRRLILLPRDQKCLHRTVSLELILEISRYLVIKWK